MYLRNGSRDGIVRLDFGDLRRQALSRDDFMHFAVQAHTVFLYNVPTFVEGDEKLARAFTHLIDAVYEHTIRFYCHSQEPIGDVVASMKQVLEAEEARGDGRFGNTLMLSD